jgi:hypothetical protein
MTKQIDTFLESYIACALLSSTAAFDAGAAPLDPSCLETMRKDCENFMEYAAEELTQYPLRLDYAGHEFWLTRNGHGSGFWGRGLGKLGDELTKKAKSFGRADLYVHDGKIYHN